jgi:outer membrane protein assembly factor BamB
VITCLDATSGEELFKKRLEAPPEPEAAEEKPAEGEGGGRGGRGGGFMNQSYSSPVVADGKLYFVTRAGLIYVFELGGEEIEQIAVNRFGTDEADFSASPAISDGEIFIRSSKKLYCVDEK